MSEFDDGDGIDQELEAIREKAGELIEPCLYKSSFTLYGELRRRSRSESRLEPYIWGTFFQMDQAQYLLDFETMRERAVELIAILENEEQARKIQPDLQEEVYESIVGWMSSCAYENLAEATGQIQGYNSDGMHACIADGMHVCRRTGKMACISCFREYASDVYIAADDLEIARHQCQTLLDHRGPWSDRGDRRWFAAKRAAWIALLNGRPGDSEKMLRKSLDLSQEEGVSLQLEARLRVLVDLDRTLLILKEPRVLEEMVPESQRPPAEEWEMLNYEMALNEALYLTLAGQHESAGEILMQWDQRLFQAKAITLWFEVRLRLIANFRIAGDIDRIDRLANQLEKEAQKGGDWLTLRRLNRLMNLEIIPDAIPLLKNISLKVSSGELAEEPSILNDPNLMKKGNSQIQPSSAQAETSLEAENADSESLDSESQTDSENLQKNDGVTVTPMLETLDELAERIFEVISSQEDTQDEMELITDDLLHYESSEIEHPGDAGRLIYLMGFCLRPNSPVDQIWKWANAIAVPYQDDATVVNVLAVLGDGLRTLDPEGVGSKITVERVEQLFTQSLKLDPTRPRNFSRAAEFYYHQDDMGNAERCCARSFRLDRTNTQSAMRLADIYKNTERPRDAIAVLDLCIRSGNEDPTIAWEAAMIALQVKRFEPMIAYLDRYDSLHPDQPWVNYYRAIGYLDLDRPSEALTAIDAELALGVENEFHINAIRSCARAQLGMLEESIVNLQAVIDTKPKTIDFLTLRGIAEIYEVCWKTATLELADEPIVSQLEDRLLQTGLMPDLFFESKMEENPDGEYSNHYRVTVRQMLDENWKDSFCCLSGQEDWDHYMVQWGILAHDADEASALALQWQKKCYPLLAEIVDVELETEGYVDAPAVCWQGFRWNESAMEELFNFDGFSDDDDEEMDDEDLDEEMEDF